MSITGVHLQQNFLPDVAVHLNSKVSEEVLSDIY